MQWKNCLEMRPEIITLRRLTSQGVADEYDKERNINRFADALTNEIKQKVI
jgi:hypothetical protein